jgi:protein-tyrosine-phosphatase
MKLCLDSDGWEGVGMRSLPTHDDLRIICITGSNKHTTPEVAEAALHIIHERESENAALRAELALLQEANDKAFEFIHSVDVEAAEEMRVTSPHATAALDRLKALEKVAEWAEKWWRLANVPTPEKGGAVEENYAEEVRAALVGLGDALDVLRSTSGSTSDKEGAGSKPIPHTTPGTKYGSGRPE